MRYLLVAALLAGAVPGWSQERRAAPMAGDVANAEMTAMYVADQAAREHPATIDWHMVRPADEARRSRTQALLDAGQLRSADDFYHAAYIFQHGDTADDCLKAHAMAVVAIARGKAGAVRIAANTLDRYLQRIGQPQIYGTQFLHPPGQKWTQEPYRRDLLPDSIREASDVSPLADQEGQREEWDRDVP